MSNVLSFLKKQESRNERMHALADRVKACNGLGGIVIVRQHDADGKFSCSWACEGVSATEVLAMLDIMRQKVLNEMVENVGDPL